MNLLNILDRLADDQFFSKIGSRTEGLSHMANFGKKAAIAGIPLGLSSFMATSAKAELQPQQIHILQLQRRQH